MNPPSDRRNAPASKPIKPDRRSPLPPATLSKRTKTGLWALRAYVLLLTAIVVYTFITTL